MWISTSQNLHIIIIILRHRQANVVCCSRVPRRRELGEWGLENFLSVKQVTSYVSPKIWEWYSPEQPSKL